MELVQIAHEYDVTEEQVDAAFAFYPAHIGEIDPAITAEERLELEGVRG